MDPAIGGVSEDCLNSRYMYLISKTNRVFWLDSLCLLHRILFKSTYKDTGLATTHQGLKNKTKSQFPNEIANN